MQMCEKMWCVCSVHKIIGAGVAQGKQGRSSQGVNCTRSTLGYEERARVVHAQHWREQKPMTCEAEASVSASESVTFSVTTTFCHLRHPHHGGKGTKWDRTDNAELLHRRMKDRQYFHRQQVMHVLANCRPQMLVQDQLRRQKPPSQTTRKQSQHQFRDNVSRQLEFLGQKQQLRVERWLFVRGGEQNSRWPS